MRLYIGLVHYPVYNKNFKRIASAITNFDLHDLSRLARTYGAKRFFVINPLEDQQQLAERIIRHWRSGYGAQYNRDRKEAFECIVLYQSIEAALEEISDLEGERPLVIAIDASKKKERRRLTYGEAVKLIRDEKVVFLLFGTAWGLDRQVVEEADYVLDPIEGATGYNHLSVRTAAAIILDRLAGRR